MDNPYKIIYKVKNNNKEYQHYLYIYVGYNIDDKVKLILNKIKNLDLFSTLILLDLNEYKYMENLYGQKWYYKFFIINHVTKSILNINKNNEKYNELLKKYGNKWIDDNIKKNYYKEKKIMYSFGDSFKLLNEQKKKINKLKEDDIEYNIKKNSMGGGEEDIDTLEIEEIDKTDELLDEDIKQENFVEESYEDEDEFDIDELDHMNKNIENIDSNLKENTKIINKIIEKDTTQEINLYKFDSSKDDNQYEDTISDNYKKYYIFNQYIYTDDTIDIIKKKITC